MRKAIAWIVILTSLLTFSALAQTQSPTGALVTLIGHLRAHDFEAAEKIMLEPERIQFFRQAQEDPIQSAVLRMLLETAEVSFGQEEIKNDQATVLLTVHSVRGEAIANLNAFLKAKSELLKETGKTDSLHEAMWEALHELDWKGLSPNSYRFRFHLTLVDGAWLLDASKQEDLNH